LNIKFKNREINFKQLLAGLSLFIGRQNSFFISQVKLSEPVPVEKRLKHGSRNTIPGSDDRFFPFPERTEYSRSPDTGTVFLLPNPTIFRSVSGLLIGGELSLAKN
jgi:hypothetical protein